MKKWFLFLLAFTNVLSGNSQILTGGVGGKKFEALIKSQLMVVLTGDRDYDDAVKAAANEFWKATPFTFIKLEDIDTRITDKTKSFLVPMNIVVKTTRTTTTKTHTGLNTIHQTSTSSSSVTKTWLSIIVGGKKRFDSYTDNDVISLAPISMYGGEFKLQSCFYRLNYMVKSLNDGVILTKENGFSGMKTPFKIIKEINKKAPCLSEKTLVINEDMKNIFGKPIARPEEFKEYYPFKYKFVSDEEYRKILSGKSGDFACFFPALEVNSHFLIYDPKTFDTVYYGFKKRGLKVKRKDLKNLSKAIKPA